MPKNLNTLTVGQLKKLLGEDDNLPVKFITDIFRCRGHGPEEYCYCNSEEIEFDLTGVAKVKHKEKIKELLIRGQEC